jgi:hypothetical protein
MNRKRSKGTKGQALLEFSLVLPALLMIMIGIIEIGRLFIVIQSVQTMTDDLAVAAARWGGYESGLDTMLGTVPLVDTGDYAWQVNTLDTGGTPVCTSGTCVCDYGEVVQVTAQYPEHLTIVFWQWPVTIDADKRRVCWRGGAP